MYLSTLVFILLCVFTVRLLRRRWRELQARQPAPPWLPPPRPAACPPHLPWPGEIWWAMVPFAEVAEAKDRPCLVLAVQGDVVTVAPITTKFHPGGWMIALPPGSVGDRRGRQSYLKLRERRNVHVSQFRRRVGPVGPDIWARVTRHSRFTFF